MASLRFGQITWRPAPSQYIVAALHSLYIIHPSLRRVGSGLHLLQLDQNLAECGPKPGKVLSSTLCIIITGRGFGHEYFLKFSRVHPAPLIIRAAASIGLLGRMVSAVVAVPPLEWPLKKTRSASIHHILAMSAGIVPSSVIHFFAIGRWVDGVVRGLLSA